MNKTTTFIIALVVVAAGAFYGGTLYQKQAAGTTATVGQRQFGAGGRGGRQANGNDFLNGQIIAQDSKSITVELRAPAGSTSSGSKIIFLGADTQISKFDPATTTDLAVGKNVTVSGTDNADGSVTAKTIQIRPTQPPGQPSPASQPNSGQ